MQFDIAIVGAGHAGAQAAIMLRQLQFSGSIGLIGTERDLPYERPPLSKEYLSGERSFERTLIRPAAFWEDRKVTLRLGATVIKVDAQRRQLCLEHGDRIEYSRLIWATGSAPRRLTCSGGQLEGVHTIRTRADIDCILAELPRTSRVAIIGGGYIGLEAAAVFRKLGKQVILLEALDRVLARVACAIVSRFYEAEHRAHGVEIQLGVCVDRIEGVNGRAVGVRLSTGEFLAADMVIVGIGVTPAIGPLVDAGAAAANGVEVDELCRTSLPEAYAIGDCAAHMSTFAGGARVRIESVQNATDQANTAAHALVNRPRPYTATPWFWSNQYDLRLQTAGLSTGFDDIVVRGEPDRRSFSVIYLRGGRVVAMDCINATQDYMQGRKLIEAGAAPPRAALMDTQRPLKELAIVPSS